MSSIKTNATSAKHLTNDISLARNESEKAKIVESLKSAQRPRVLSFINAHAFNLAWRNGGFRQALSDSDYLLRDGIGIKLLFASMGRNAGLNLNGTDFIPELLQSMPGATIQIYGANEKCNKLAVELAKDWKLDVVDHDMGFHDSQVYIDRAKANRSDIIVLAMGMPKQELLAMQLRDAIDYPALIINGGAVFNIVSGVTVRAPAFVRAVGLEWLHRLMLEPQRLWKRYIVGIPVFLSRIVIMALASWKGSLAPFRTSSDARSVSRDRNG